MTDAEKPRFLAAMNALASVFRVDASPTWLKGYWSGLRSLDIGDLEAAAQRALTKCEHMPTPAQLRKLATKAWAERNGMYFLEGTGWVQDPYSDAARKGRLEAASEAKRLSPWPEEA